MKHKFIINDENIVNEYGYRVMTDGIDTVQFMRNPVVLFIHERGFAKSNGPEGHEVIGRVVALEKKDGQLIAEIEFDVEDDFAKKIAGKVDRGYIRMASIYADVIETSIDADDILPGQIFETVMTSKLVEVSIVDIGGNDNALKLSREGKRIKLKRLKSKPEINSDMDMKSIALALGMGAETKPETVLGKVNELKLAKEQAEAENVQLKAQIKEASKEEGEALIDKAVKLNLIPEGLKESQQKAYEADPKGQKAVLSKLISDKEAETAQEGKETAVREVILNGKKGEGKRKVELSFDYLQKNDPEELRRLRDEEPQEYAKLAKDYAAGKRHKA